MIYSVLQLLLLDVWCDFTLTAAQELFGISECTFARAISRSSLLCASQRTCYLLPPVVAFAFACALDQETCGKVLSTDVCCHVPQKAFPGAQGHPKSRLPTMSYRNRLREDTLGRPQRPDSHPTSVKPLPFLYLRQMPAIA